MGIYLDRGQRLLPYPSIRYCAGCDRLPITMGLAILYRHYCFRLDDEFFRLPYIRSDMHVYVKYGFAGACGP